MIYKYALFYLKNEKTHFMVRILIIGETISLICGTILDQDGDSAPSMLLEEYNLGTSSAAISEPWWLL